MARFNVQITHSRNGHDWKYEQDSSGRHRLYANKKGMKQRIVKTTGFLFKQDGQASRQEILAYLQTLHPSYEMNDLSQLYRQLRTHGVIEEADGFGPDSVWKLTRNARSIMAQASYRWV